MKSFYLVAFFFISTGVFSQNTELDSLLKILKTQNDDTKKVADLNRISNIYYRIGDQINAVEYAKKGLILSEK
jgi:hypothetical protein